MVDHPSGYLWSSYAVNSGMRSDPFISTHTEYLALATDLQLRRAAYRGLFDQGLEPGLKKVISEATNGGYPLASEAFKRNVLAPNGWRTEPGHAGRPAKSPEAIYAPK
jgi:putative transposase